MQYNVLIDCLKVAKQEICYRSDSEKDEDFIIDGTELI